MHGAGLAIFWANLTTSAECPIRRAGNGFPIQSRALPVIGKSLNWSLARVVFSGIKWIDNAAPRA